MKLHSTILFSLSMCSCAAKFDAASSETEEAPASTISGETIVENGEEEGVVDTGAIYEDEICDGIDNDGDGEIDEELLIAFYWDRDGDGWGGSNDVGCELPEGAVLEPGDCDDENEAIHPDAEEVCNEIDDDCDLNIDEGLNQTFYADNDGDTYGTPLEAISACAAPEGFVDNADDCDDEASIISPDSLEICNYQDDNCDGIIDEDLQTLVYPDADGDGFGVLLEPVMLCGVPLGYTTTPGDCDDSTPSINPDGIEICDELDNDCNGLIDDSPVEGTISFWTDLDGDGHGNGIALSGCTVPEGYSDTDDDCDDMDASLSPSAEEICNELDDNCNGLIDEEVLETFYVDVDGDGYGTTRVLACTMPDGAALLGDDCNDSDASVNPGADELCDGADSNCNGSIDEEPIDGTSWFADVDEDGFGDPDEEDVLCYAPPGFVANSDDCDPSRGDVFPAADEVCNGIDDDCDGETDEDSIDAPTWFLDEDDDGYGIAGVTEEACTAPDGFVDEAGDCDDTDITIFPYQDETCDDIDNDCDDEVDEDAIDMIRVFPDEDEDGFGSSTAASIGMCEDDMTAEWSTNSEDCNDEMPTINPDGVEACNGMDDNCNGEIDEDAGDRVPVYVDADLDGYGSGTETTLVCEVAEGWSLVNTDCNDEDPSKYPDADEFCNGMDDDCDGSIDELAVDRTWVFPDEDEDGYGVTAEGILTCDPSDDWVLLDGDCDDDDEDLHPGRVETCDGYDENCDGIVDNGATDCECTQRNYGSHSYMFCNSDKKWHQARDWCEGRDYLLVTVNSSAEQIWLINKIRYDSSIANDSHWIGLNDRDIERYSSRSGWVWRSGESYSYSAWRDFTPWTQPDNAGGGWEDRWGGEDCVEMNRWNGPVEQDWNDLPCDHKIRFICEAKP